MSFNKRQGSQTDQGSDLAQQSLGAQDGVPGLVQTRYWVSYQGARWGHHAGHIFPGLRNPRILASLVLICSSSLLLLLTIMTMLVVGDIKTPRLPKLTYLFFNLTKLTFFFWYQATSSPEIDGFKSNLNKMTHHF